MSAQVVPPHHPEDERGVMGILLQHGHRFETVWLSRLEIALTGDELRGVLGASPGDDVFGVPKGQHEDFRVQPADVVCLLCVEHFYKFPREVNGG